MKASRLTKPQLRSGTLWSAWGFVVGELAQTPEAARAKAQATLKAREDGIRAAAIKQGYAARDKEWCAKLGVESVDQALQINRLIAERDARPTLDQYHRHGIARLFQGVAFGGLAFGSIITIGAMWIVSTLIDDTFDAAGRIRAQSDITEALVRSQQEPQAEPYVNPGQDVTRRP